MYPCCNNVVTKRKLVIMSLIAIAIVSTFYFILASTSNISDSGLAIFSVLGFAACPAICAAIGGGMWVANRFTNKKNQIVNRGKETDQKPIRQT